MKEWYFNFLSEESHSHMQPRIFPLFTSSRGTITPTRKLGILHFHQPILFFNLLCYVPSCVCHCMSSAELHVLLDDAVVVLDLCGLPHIFFHQ
jgi:hypothetical protein